MDSIVQVIQMQWSNPKSDAVQRRSKLCGQAAVIEEYAKLRTMSSIYTNLVAKLASPE